MKQELARTVNKREDFVQRCNNFNQLVRSESCYETLILLVIFLVIKYAQIFAVIQFLTFLLSVWDGINNLNKISQCVPDEFHMSSI